MLEFLQRLFDSTFMPHGHCYLWKPGLVWLHAGSDAAIALAYFTIPVLLIWFVRRRSDLAFKWMFVLFGLFIFLCGVTHVMGIWTIWNGTYWAEGALKLSTGVISVATAILLVPLVPKALQLPAPSELKRANEVLQKRTEELQERGEQVRELATRLARAEREERHRISLVLHDDLQQRLYAIDMKMNMLKAQYDGDNQAGFDEQVDEVLNFVDEAIGVTRRLSTHLSPPVLENEGLREAVGWLASEMKRMHGLAVEIEVEDDEAEGVQTEGKERMTDEDLRVLLFQVIRELLFNVVKHAGVDAARVNIRHSEEAIRIRVSDEGQGFDPDRAVPQDSEAFGLADARKRLQLVDGTLEIESAPGEGTRVAVQVPTSPVELYP
jgi:signal transduction histidine kinase